MTIIVLHVITRVIPSIYLDVHESVFTAYTCYLSCALLSQTTDINCGFHNESLCMGLSSDYRIPQQQLL